MPFFTATFVYKHPFCTLSRVYKVTFTLDAQGFRATIAPKGASTCLPAYFPTPNGKA
jgi:hypothetical protein